MPTFSFNGAAFPGTVRPTSKAFELDLGEQDIPRRDGALTQPGRIKGRTLQCKGVNTNVSPAALLAQVDAFRKACLAAGRLPAPLIWGNPSRYIMAQLQTAPEDYTLGEQSGIGYWETLELTFFAADPYFYAATGPETVPLNGSGSLTITPDGTGDAAPVWTLVVGAAGTGVITLYNALTQETATISGTFNAGDTIALDRTAYTVALNGASGAATFGLLNGSIPGLPQGANAVSVSVAPAAGATSTALTVGNASVAYTPRFL